MLGLAIARLDLCGRVLTQQVIVLVMSLSNMQVHRRPALTRSWYNLTSLLLSLRLLW